MANPRVVLQNGTIEPLHGAGYEPDLDANWVLIDKNMGGLAAVDLGLSGVASGFVLSTSASLAPGLSNGVLYAQGLRYAPASAPAAPAAPNGATNYLFYNFATGFYYQAGAVGLTGGDALIGQVVAAGGAVTGVTTAIKIYGSVSLAPAAAGNFTVQHFLGRAPVGISIRMTSGGAIWFQNPSDIDGTNLYLVASTAGVTAKAVIW